jgi:HAD superfamily hydrolase (TIGR01509 family)
MIKGLFFDLDGTLVNTLEANIQAYIAVGKKAGVSITREMFVSTFGKRIDKWLPEFYPDITDKKIEQIKKYKAEIYPDHLHLATPHTKLIDFIRTVRPHHVTALVTTAQKKNAQAVMDAMGISDLFDHFVAGNEVEHPKPHPEAYLKALGLAKLQPAEVLAFEDSKTGIEAAHKAGLQVMRIRSFD